MLYPAYLWFYPLITHLISFTVISFQINANFVLFLRVILMIEPMTFMHSWVWVQVFMQLYYFISIYISISSSAAVIVSSVPDKVLFQLFLWWPWLCYTLPSLTRKPLCLFFLSPIWSSPTIFIHIGNHSTNLWLHQLSSPLAILCPPFNLSLNHLFDISDLNLFSDQHWPHSKLFKASIHYNIVILYFLANYYTLFNFIFINFIQFIIITVFLILFQIFILYIRIVLSAW